MARNPHPEVTERRILAAAKKLFAEKGYDKTSIQDIIDKLGDLSRGCDLPPLQVQRGHPRTTEHRRLARQPGPVRRDRETRRHERDGKAPLAVRQLAGRHRAPGARQGHRAVLRRSRHIHRQQRFWSTELPKNLDPLIEEGQLDGSIPTEYPREVAQLLALLCNYWLMPCFFPATRTQLRYRLQCLATMLDALHAPVFDQHLIDLATDGMMAFAGDGSGSAAEQQDGGGTSPVSDAH